MLDPATVQARIRGEQARTLLNIASETAPPEQGWWISFADETFRGAVIVQANDFVEAIMRAHLAGINPGGEAQGMLIPAETAAKIPEHWKNRLLSREECQSFDAEMKKAPPSGLARP